MDDSNNGRSFGFCTGKYVPWRMLRKSLSNPAGKSPMIRAKIRKENLALKWLLPEIKSRKQ
jgi:hypothetical protein